jgi:hypothetical protein
MTPNEKKSLENIIHQVTCWRRFAIFYFGDGEKTCGEALGLTCGPSTAILGTGQVLGLN